MPRCLFCRRRRRRKDFGMKLSELGKPDEYLFVWRGEIGRLENFGSERGGGRGSSPGFAKWTVQEAAGERFDWLETEGFYCCEAQVHFTGKRLDGTWFASTREDGLNASREKAVFTIPPELAGTKSRCPVDIPGNIAPNEALRFDIELISLVTITDILDDEGILTKIIKRGLGSDKPCDLDEVLGFFCPAFARAVETMTEGEEAVLIVKPEYGFGERGRPSIGDEAGVPPDATLYVYLQLMSWKTVRHIGENGTILKKTLRRGNLEGQQTENEAVVGVRLIGKLQDGAVFDQRGHEGDEPFKFMVDEEQVSEGLEEAVLTMREGEVSLFTIPPHRVQDQLLVVPAGSSVTYEIELVSVVNDKPPRLMSQAETIEAAAEKEKEGDKLFSSSKFLRAYRRYYKARQIILLRSGRGETDEEIKQMLISLTFKAAECANQLQRYEQAYHRYREILEYDPGNVKAREMTGRAFPEASLGIDTAAMHRGLDQLFRPKEEFRVCGYMVPEFSEMRLKQGHKYHGSINIFVPPIPRPETNANQAVPVAPTGHRLTHSPTTPPGANNEKTNSSSRVPVAARKGLLASDASLQILTEDMFPKSNKGKKNLEQQQGFTNSSFFFRTNN
uniref:peptidylprolyl isomerase n=1 Tax=Oryza barthii TaxID=65489 RepID=A0A0D3EQ82_9ORYZ